MSHCHTLFAVSTLYVTTLFSEKIEKEVLYHTSYESKTALSPKNPAKAPPLSLPEKQCSAFHNNTFKCNKSLY